MRKKKEKDISFSNVMDERKKRVVGWLLNSGLGDEKKKRNDMGNSTIILFFEC